MRCHDTQSTSRWSNVATSRALLYKETRHWVWYLASCAIMSPALNFARRAVSCNLTALCLTRTSTWKVDALRKVSPTGGMPQKKHVSVEGGASSTDWWVNFLEAAVLSSMRDFLFSAHSNSVLLNCNQQESRHLAWCCWKVASMHTHHHLTLIGWLS